MLAGRDETSNEELRSIWTGRDPRGGLTENTDDVHSGCEKIRAVIGGFHLVNAGPERMEKTRAALRKINPGILAPCHCTGDVAMDELKNDREFSVEPCHAGKRFVF